MTTGKSRYKSVCCADMLWKLPEEYIPAKEVKLRKAIITSLLLLFMIIR
jgi:hypothetical protein